MGADEFVEVDGEAGRDDAEVGAEVEGGGYAEGGVGAVRILYQNSQSWHPEGIKICELTQSLNLPKIPTSTSAC